MIIFPKKIDTIFCGKGVDKLQIICYYNFATNFIVWEYSSTVRMTVSKTEDAGSIPATPASSVLFNRACGSFKRARGPQYWTSFLI